MDRSQPRELRARLLRRRMSRRTILAGGGALAAGGAATAAASLYAFPDASGGADDGAGSPAANRAPEEPLDGVAWAGHLLRRAGFGGSRAELERFARLPKEEAVEELLAIERVNVRPLEERLAAMGFSLEPGSDGIVRDMQGWWLSRMALTPRPLEERVTYFWHGLLTTQVSVLGPDRAHWCLWQNELYRSKGLGRFDELIHATAKDPAMMVYLDTVESTKEHPNENFARELLELFTMGEGNYTEEDVREAARAFTGWRLTRPRVQFDPDLSEEERRERFREALRQHRPEWFLAARQHDFGEKTFLGRTGPWGGEEIIDIVLEQPATARYISRRLFRFFVHDEPTDEELEPLVAAWNESGHEIRSLVRTILLSPSFGSFRAYRALVRSPVEFVVGMLRGLELDPAELFRAERRREGAALVRAYIAMDQLLFNPPNVAGWPGGPAWLSSSTFFARLNFLDAALFPGGRPRELPLLAGLSDPDELLEVLSYVFLDGELRDSARTVMRAHLQEVSDAHERRATAAYLVLASPEYQLI